MLAPNLKQKEEKIVFKNRKKKINDDIFVESGTGRGTVYFTVTILA
jgi:hypothetical protein